MTADQRAVFSRTPLEILDKFLRGELAAASTYERAVDHIDDPQKRTTLEQCRQSHADRAVMIAQQLEKRGHEPSHTAGPWGLFAKAVETGAAAISDRALLEVLLAGERNGLRQYEVDTMGLDAKTRDAVQYVLISEQLETTQRLEKLANQA